MEAGEKEETLSSPLPLLCFFRSRPIIRAVKTETEKRTKPHRKRLLCRLQKCSSSEMALRANVK